MFFVDTTTNPPKRGPKWSAFEHWMNRRLSARRCWTKKEVKEKALRVGKIFFKLVLASAKLLAWCNFCINPAYVLAQFLTNMCRNIKWLLDDLERCALFDIERFSEIKDCFTGTWVHVSNAEAAYSLSDKVCLRKESVSFDLAMMQNKYLQTRGDLWLAMFGAFGVVDRLFYFWMASLSVFWSTPKWSFFLNSQHVFWC